MILESYSKDINANQTSEPLAVPKITLTKKGLKFRIDLKRIFEFDLRNFKSNRGLQ